MKEHSFFLKELGKNCVRPLLIPFVRLCVRYAPNGNIRQSVWFRIVAPFFLYADHNFVTTTIFGVEVAGNTKDFIQRHLFYFGVWEPNLTEFLRKRLCVGDTFVDVGANIGYFALLASRLVGTEGKVIAIEASPSIFARLLDNLQRNKTTTNVHPINVAVSNRNGTVNIYQSSSSEFNIGMTSIVESEGALIECEVPSRPLDSLLTPKDLANARVVKIDVEGAEWLVINGMLNILREARSDLEVVVELNPDSLRQHGKTVEDVCEIFGTYGFFPYSIENDYSENSYIFPNRTKCPLRLKSPVSKQMDVVFSRIKSEYL